MENKPNILKWMLLFLFGLLLAACGGSVGNSNTSNNAAAPPEVIEEEPETFTTSLPLGFELGLPELKATDPTDAALAKGEPQIIEFFAFW